MADKASFTKEEWTLLLESPMIAGMAVTAADPSGLWGLLKESFAGGTALTRAVTGADTNPLVKAVVTDFSTSEGRSAARDGLKVKFASSQPSDLKIKAVDALRQVSALINAKLKTMHLRLKLGFARSAKAPQRRPAKVVVCSDLVASKSATPRRRRLLKYQLLWELERMQRLVLTGLG